MVNSTNFDVSFVQEIRPDPKVILRHPFYGAFLWEFVTTLDYEWKVIRGHIPYRWTIWIYSVSRVACLVSLILNAIMMNVTTHINCQFFAHLALVAASLLIVLRITAIWNRNKIVVTMAISVWAINFGFLIQGAALLREDGSASVLSTASCISLPSFSRRLTLISLGVTDIALLLIMLVGLFRLRHDGYGTFGLARLLWNQGVIWILIATLVEIPPAVCAILNVYGRPAAVAYLLSLEPQQLRIPAVVTMTIAATRMHRSLVDFSNPDVAPENFQTSGPKFAKLKPIRVTPIPLETSTFTISQQHMTRQMNDHGWSASMDEDVYEGPNGSTLEEYIGRGE